MQPFAVSFVASASLVALVMAGNSSAQPMPAHPSMTIQENHDGHTHVKPGQGLRLPDWAIVEQQFRARSRADSAALDQSLRVVEAAYRKAAAAPADLFRQSQPAPTAQEQKDIEQLFQIYNKKVEDLGRAFFQGSAPPLPRLRPLAQDQWEELATNWMQARRTKLAAEKLALLARQVKEDNDAWRQGYLETLRLHIVTSEMQNVPRSKTQIANEMNGLTLDLRRMRKSLQKLQRDADMALQAAAQLQNGLISKLIDSSAVLPDPEGFSQRKEK